MQKNKRKEVVIMRAAKKVVKVKPMNHEAMEFRLKKMLDLRNEFMQNIDEHHVKLQRGNSKTGANCYTVSLMPIADCVNCSGCKQMCYDIRNVCVWPNVQNDRARNSAIHKADIHRFWDEVDMQIKANFVTQLRINVGGDLLYTDFFYITKIADRNPKCHFLFFTKSYKEINQYLDEGNVFPSNVHPVMSAWEGMEMDNPYNLPVSHVLYADGRTTAPDFGAYYCSGNCSECFMEDKGCWTMKAGEAVIFPCH